MSEKKYKNDYNEKRNSLSFKAIDILKEHIQKIDANQIVFDALNSAKHRHRDRNLIKNEVLTQTKKNVINSFFSEINNKEKKIKLIKTVSEKKLKNFSNSIKLLEERARKEAKEHISKYEILNNENKVLNQKLLNINKQFNDINIQQKNFLNQISDMEKIDKIILTNKNILNDFFKYYKDKDPKKIMEDIEKQNDGFLSISKEYNNTINKIIFQRKLFDIKYSNNKKKISKVNSQILNLKEENFLMQKDFENAVNDLQKEITNLQGLKEDNDKYRKMLYQLYNRLIKAYCLDKNIRKNKKFLKLTKEDYKPNLLDDNEICKYIKLMISSMNPSTSDQLLRETIAYSNMITRVYLKNKINLKYDPLSTFKELKEIMEKNEEKIIELSNNVKEYEDKINKMGIENKKLNSIINYFHQEKNKIIENKQNINLSNNIMTPLNIKYKKKLNELNTCLSNRAKHSKLTKNKITENRLKSSTSNMSNRSKPKSKIITRNTEENKNKTFSSEIIGKKIKNTKSRHTLSGIYDEDDIIYQYHSIDAKELKNPIFQSLQSMNSNPLINKHNKSIDKFMDKLKKIGGKQNDPQSMATYINEFQKLISHINRLFLYKAKNSYIINRGKNLKNIKNKRNNDFNNLINNIKKNESTGNLLQNYVKGKIVGRLNGIINNLEYKEKDNDKHN